MRLRQLVFVSKERDRLAKEICDVFDLKEAYNDPGLISFGLENVLIPLNDTFFEIVMPVKENTTAERFFEKNWWRRRLYDNCRRRKFRTRK